MQANIRLDINTQSCCFVFNTDEGMDFLLQNYTSILCWCAIKNHLDEKDGSKSYGAMLVEFLFI